MRPLALVDRVVRLLSRRLSVIGTTLRAREPAEKGRIVSDVVQHLWPVVDSGQVEPVVDRVLPLSDAPEAHRRLEQGDVVGKVVLQVR